MSENNTDALRTWLIVLPFIFILFLAAVFLAFVNVEDLTTEQRLDYGIKALTTTGTIFAGIAVFINAFYAAKRAEAMEKSALAANESAKAALKNAEAALKNAVIAEDKQITERFAKAIEQLGSEKIEVRLGAIYTLERIAKDSPKDHWTIMEVLTAFVRENASLSRKENNTTNTKPLITYWINESKVNHIKQEIRICIDIQAALTVIGKRDYKSDPENQRLDLSNIDIRGANFFEAKLQRAIFKGANLERTRFCKAELQEVDFEEANLLEVDFEEANLQESNFKNANLQKAILSKANLDRAVLLAANLQGANLYDAILARANLYQANMKEAYLNGTNLSNLMLKKSNLENAKLQGANLQSANLTGANLQRATFHEANLQKAKLICAELQETDMTCAALQGANFQDANLKNLDMSYAKLQRANFTGVKNLEQEQIDSAEGDRTTILPDYLEYPKHWQ